jgi:Cys-tRNA(Pro)/Cys-tRNA(Cys) deacylase
MSHIINETPPVSIALERLGISHQVFRHANPVTSLERAARERGQRPGQVVRSILFRVTENEFVLVLVAGPAPISWKALRKTLGKSRISMATEDEVQTVTGYRIGTVGPFGLSRQIKILIEAGVLSEEEISLGSGMPNTAIMLRSADLRQGRPNAAVVSLIE